MTNHLTDALLRSAESDPERPFAILADGRRIAYGEMGRMSGGIAHHLVERGVAPGDRVAAQVDKSIEAVALYLATLRAGAVFVPLNPAYTPQEIAYFLQDCEPAVLVCAPERTQALATVAAASGVQLETLGAEAGEPSTLAGAAAGEAGPFSDRPRAAEDLAAILYTSGTTGRAKGAMLSHGNLLSNARTLMEAWEISADDHLLHALPIFHTHGLFVAINPLMLAGGRMTLMPRFDPGTVLDALPRATLLMGVPTFYTRLLDDPRLTREACSGMRLFTSGSAPLLAATHEAFTERTGHRILERYGMTETNMNTSNPYRGERRPGSVGPPLPGVELRICDPRSGSALGCDGVGQIEVRGPNVFAGYWRMPEKTAAEMRQDGFFVTGDLGFIDGDGYVTIVGREKDLVISGGLNIYPREVELAIDAVEGVTECAVIGVPHRDLGEAAVAVVVAHGPLAEADILEALQGQIARFKQPRRIVSVEELPRNAMGKVQKNVLRERFRELLTGADET